MLIEGNAAEQKAQINFPGAEIVKDKYSIVQYANINLVILSVAANTYPNLTVEVLRSGKRARITSQV